MGLLLGLGLMGEVLAAESPAKTPPVNLTVQDETISATLRRVPLGRVLAELAQQANLTIYVTESDAKRIVTARFKKLPMLEGIKYLLDGQNYALVTESIPGTDGKPSRVRISQIRVLSEGKDYTKITGRQPEDDLERLKREVAEAADAEARLAALRAVAAKSQSMTDEEFAAVVVPALKDQAPEIRHAALRLVHTTVGVEEGLMDHLAEMAQGDDNPKLRSKALWYMTGVDELMAEKYLKQALEDPDAKVRKRAQRLLRKVDEVRNEQEEEKDEVPAQTSPTTQ